jgi:hypothetical protein
LRQLVTRHETLAASLLGMLKLAAAHLWPHHYEICVLIDREPKAAESLIR